MKRDDERATKRPERIPLHKQRVFTSQSRPGYVQYWVLDKLGRVERFLKAGWSFAQGENSQTHEGLAQVESQMGSRITRVVNKDPNAHAQIAVLMEIPEEFYKADQAEKQKLIDEKEASFDPSGVLRPGGNFYGSISINSGKRGNY